MSIESIKQRLGRYDSELETASAEDFRETELGFVGYALQDIPVLLKVAEAAEALSRCPFCGAEKSSHGVWSTTAREYTEYSRVHLPDCPLAELEAME